MVLLISRTTYYHVGLGDEQIVRYSATSAATYLRDDWIRMTSVLAEMIFSKNRTAVLSPQFSLLVFHRSHEEGLQNAQISASYNREWRTVRPREFVSASTPDGLLRTFGSTLTPLHDPSLSCLARPPVFLEASLLLQ